MTTPYTPVVTWHPTITLASDSDRRNRTIENTPLEQLADNVTVLDRNLGRLSNILVTKDVRDYWQDGVCELPSGSAYVDVTDGGPSVYHELVFYDVLTTEIFIIQSSLTGSCQDSGQAASGLFAVTVTVGSGEPSIVGSREKGFFAEFGSTREYSIACSYSGAEGTLKFRLAVKNTGGRVYAVQSGSWLRIARVESLVW